MARSGLRFWRIAGVMVASLLLWRGHGGAIQLDKDGDMKLGVRTYVNARVGTEDTHDGVLLGGRAPDGELVTTSTSATFPHSDAGHLRQNRLFLEAELNHDVSRLVKEGVGPFSLINDLPFRVKHLAYHVTFRGEGESLYDWGPKEYSTASEFKKARDTAIAIRGQAGIDVTKERQKLRDIGVHRERLFQAYVEGNVGDLFWRVGRQILSWGETDGFQLLDHINPLDASFGGFLIPLDERRIPLDMVLGNYYIGDFGPISEAFLEAYVAVDDKVGYDPGTPAGSPWALPSLGGPPSTNLTLINHPARTVDQARGGFLLKFNAADATFSLAHYYTYFDTPALQVSTTQRGLTQPFDDGLPCGGNLGPLQGHTTCGYPAHVVEMAPRVQVTGATTTFAVPKFYSVVRSEVAYFKGEPSFTQGQLDPFIFHPVQGSIGPQTGGRRLRDSINAVLGIDMNQWVRALNPNQTFLISTQFFFKHILDAGKGGVRLPNRKLNPDREVLPVDLDVGNTSLGRLEPIFVTQPQDQYLQTLFIGTSYRSGTVSPGVTIFYDWGGAFLYQPSLTLSRDPFRFIIDYSVIDAHIYKGGSGVSLLKDRDNVEFRLEYVI